MINTLAISIQTTTTILDTVKISSASSLDLISKVDAFYNNAWTKLIWIIGIFFTVIAVVTPVITLLIQKRELKLGEEKLKKDIKDSEKRLKAYIKTEYDNAIIELSSKNNENLTALETKLSKKVGARTNYLQGLMELQQKDYIRSFYLFYLSTSSYLELSDDFHSKITLDALINNIDTVVKSDIVYLMEFKQTTFQDELKRFASLTTNYDLLNKILELQKVFSDMPDEDIAQEDELPQ